MQYRINHILFDLDNTLYSARYGLEQAVSRRVNEYIARYLDLPLEEAWERRKERIKARGYGTTLEWLLAEENFGPAQLDDYFAYIHPRSDADDLPPDPSLRPFLESLGLPLAILTNAPREHAQRYLEKLNVTDLFTSIFDIRGNGLKGKPRPDVFFSVLAQMGTTPEECLFVDDVRSYIEGYRAIGGFGVYLDELDEHPEFPGPRIRRLEELKTLL